MKKDIASICFALALLWTSPTGGVEAGEKNQKKPLKAVILCFHDIGGAGQYSITPAEFEQILKLLKEKYQVFSIRDWLQLAQESPKSDKPVVVLTFDDGYFSLFSYVIPQLTRYGFGGTFYIYLDRYPDSSSVYQNLGKLPAQFEIGSHSRSHANMEKTYVNDENGFFKELYLSRKKLEHLIGHEVTSWAWPYGIYNEALAHLALKAGYTTQVTTDYTPALSNDFTFSRYTVQNPNPVQQVVEILARNR